MEGPCKLPYLEGNPIHFALNTASSQLKLINLYAHKWREANNSNKKNKNKKNKKQSHSLKHIHTNSLLSTVIILLEFMILKCYSTAAVTCATISTTYLGILLRVELSL